MDMNAGVIIGTVPLPQLLPPAPPVDSMWHAASAPPDPYSAASAPLAPPPPNEGMDYMGRKFDLLYITLAILIGQEYLITSCVAFSKEKKNQHVGYRGKYVMNLFNRPIVIRTCSVGDRIFLF